MTPINAIGKVRFNSAKPQRVHLVEGRPCRADLLCLEPRQELAVPVGGLLYVLTGSAAVTCGGQRATLPSGHLLSAESECVLGNVSEQRLVCLLFAQDEVRLA